MIVTPSGFGTGLKPAAQARDCAHSPLLALRAPNRSTLIPFDESQRYHITVQGSINHLEF
jgi:hypothetical protein